MGLFDFLKQQTNPNNHPEIQIDNKSVNTKTKSENMLFQITQEKWLKYYQTFLDIKFALVEQGGEHDGEYDTSKLIFVCFFNKNKSKTENKLILEKVSNLIFPIYDVRKKSAKDYVNEIKEIFPTSKENQARLFFLVDQAVDSHIPVWKQVYFRMSCNFI